MRAVGITPEYIRELTTSGLMRPSREDLVEARAAGLYGTYIQAMADAGYHGSINRLIQLRELGIRPADLLARTGSSRVPAPPGPSG